MIEKDKKGHKIREINRWKDIFKRGRRKNKRKDNNVLHLQKGFFLVTIKRLKDSRFKKNNEKQRNSFFLVYLDFLLLIINVTYRNLLEFFE